jgi:hypothetical protein
MNMIKVWWRTGYAEKPDQNLTEGLRQYLQGRAPPPALAAFDPEYRTLSDDETAEVLNKRTLGGRPVRLEDGPN